MDDDLIVFHVNQYLFDDIEHHINKLIDIDEFIDLDQYLDLVFNVYFNVNINLFNNDNVGMIGWRAYYDNGTIFSSLETQWGELPAFGLQVLVEFFNDGTRKIHHARDYYILDDGKAYGTNHIHPYLEKMRTVKFGRWANDGFYRELLDKAQNDVFHSGESLSK